MHKIFVPLYEFFDKHKALMYIILALTTVLFGFFAVKMRFEEDLTKLIPSGESTEKTLAFGNLRVKDKIIVQLTAAPDSTASPLTLSASAEEFVQNLYAADTDSTLIDVCLYNIRNFAPAPDQTEDISTEEFIRYLPTIVDTSCYRRFDRLIEGERLAERMKRNKETVENDSVAFVYSPDSTVYVEIMASDLVMMDPVGLLPAILGDEKAASNIREQLPYTIIDGQLFSRDSTVAYVFISPGFKSLDTAAGSDLVEIIEEEGARLTAKYPNIEFLFHGAPVRGVNNSRRIKADLAYTVLLSLLVIFIVLAFCFRDWKIIPFQLLPVGYGTIFALAAVYLIKGKMSLMATGLGALVIGVALSYCLHLLIHNKYIGDAKRMLSDESTPVVLGCLTTVGAFLGLLFTKSELLRDFGLFSSLVLTGSTLFALIFLPHFLKKGDTRKNEKIIRIIDRFNNVQFDKSRPLMLLIAVLTVVCIFFSFKIGFDKDLRNLSYFADKTLRSEKLFSINNMDGDSIQCYYAATADNLDEALYHHRDVVRIIDSLQKEGIVHTYTDAVGKVFVPEAIQQERIEAWNAYWTPDKIAEWRSAIAKAKKANRMDGEWDLFLYDYVIEDDTDGIVLKEYEPVNLYDTGLIPESVISNFIEKTSDGQYLIFTAVNVRTQDEKDAVSDAVTRHGTSRHGIVIDPMYYIQDMVGIIHDDFDLAVGISSIFVLLVLLLSFKSMWSALLAFVPMGLSWYVVKGVMYLCGIQFNLFNIVISTFIFGVGVDYSIFVMEGLLSVARTGSRNLLVWHKSAIFFSAFVLIVVTVALMFARHTVISSIGLATLIGMLTTIVFTYTIQPYIFRQMMKVPYFQKCFRKQ